jgi:hypothetical protein
MDRRYNAHDSIRCQLVRRTEGPHGGWGCIEPAMTNLPHDWDGPGQDTLNALRCPWWKPEYAATLDEAKPDAKNERES